MTRGIAVPFAIRNGVIIDVAEVSSGLQLDCLCPACHEPLVARKGEIKTHHFAHRSHSTCEGESALHELGKRLIVEKIENALKRGAPLPMRWRCDTCELEHTGDLIKEATCVGMERTLDGCRPDIVLSREDGTPVAIIEVVVTHAPDDNVIEFCGKHGIALIIHRVKSVAALAAIRRLDEYIPDNVNRCRCPKCPRCGHRLRHRRTLLLREGPCWKCGKPMKVVIPALDECMLLRLEQMNDTERRIAAEKGVLLDRRYSQTTKARYMANICGSCNAFVGEFYLTNYACLEGETIHTGWSCGMCDTESNG